MLRADIVLSADLVTSVAIELVLMPLLSLWLARMVRTTTPGPTRAHPQAV